MPSQRRVKVFGVMVFLVVVIVLFRTSSLRQQRAHDPHTAGDFYAKTVNALDQRPDPPGSPKTEDEQEISRAMSERLKQAAQVAKDNANAKAPKPDPPSELVGVGNAADAGWEERGVAGRRKIPPHGPQDQVKESEEDHKIEAELNIILKKSPIIIFSKSYCPHSRRAKKILLEKYIIEPAPFVVELDEHPLGAKLQARLAELTARKTVPNVLINGVSIGGGDDVADLDVKQTLVQKVKDLGGKRMVEVKLRPIEEGDHGLR